MEEPRKPAKSQPRARRPSLPDRVRAHCDMYPPTRFTVDAMVTIAYIIEQIAPDRDPLELAQFMDWATGRLLGRLGQKPGMPNEAELFVRGLEGVDELSRARHGKPFRDLTPARRRAVVESIEEGQASGGVWCEIPPQYFYKRFYTKVLHGVFAERKEWVQIGILRSADLTDRPAPNPETSRAKKRNTPAE